MDQTIIDLYDQYTHTSLDRRTFLARLAKLTGSLAAASALIPLLAANQAHAHIVPAHDSRLQIEHTLFPGTTCDIKGYLASPKGSGKLPTVIVIHENRGLNPHIEDVTRRMALEGFLVLAPDLLSPLGGTPANEDTAREMIGKLDSGNTVANLRGAVDWLAHHDQSNGKVGAMGFCWGGGMTGELAVHAPKLAAAVVYYGRQPKAAGVETIQAPLLLHYAGLDKRINEGIAEFEGALKQAGKPYELHLYEGVNHAFNNDTSEARYNKVAADLAWSRTVAFLKNKLAA